MTSMKRFAVFFLALGLAATAAAQSIAFKLDGTVHQHKDTVTYYVNSGDNTVEGFVFHNNTEENMTVMASLVAMEAANGMAVTGSSNAVASNSSYFTNSFTLAAGADYSGCTFDLTVPGTLEAGDTGWFYMLVSDASTGNPDSSAGSYVFVCMVVAPEEGFTVFEEDFNSMVNSSSYFYTLPDGWTTIGDGQANYSNYSGFGDSWTGLNVSGDVGLVAASTSYLSSTGARANRWLVTPAITIPYGGLSLVFTLYGVSDSYPESLKVLLSTTTNEQEAFTTTLFNMSRVQAGGCDYVVDLSAYAGQTVYFAFVNYGKNGYYVLIDNVRVMSPIQNEIELTDLTLPTYAAMDEDMYVTGTVTNRGVAPLHEYQVRYSANGTVSAVYTVTGIDVALNGTHTFTHNVPYRPASTGQHTVEVTVSLPNGMDDDEENNTLSRAMTVYDAANTLKRNVLMENFTTAQCGNCPTAHSRIKNALRNRNDVIWVAHHVGYGTDSWTLQASNTLTRFYNANSTYAPALMLDRTRFEGDAFTNGDGEQAPGPVFLPASDVATAIQTASEVPAMVRVALDNTTYDAETRTVTTTVKAEFLNDMNMQSPRVTLYLIEDSLYGTQSGGSSNYQHDHVIRAAINGITGESGVITATTAGSTAEKTYTYTLNNAWRAEHCRLVAFVNNYNTANVNDCKVMNATISDYLHDGEVGIDAAEYVDLRLYPNPATEFCVLESADGIEEVRVMNALGQEQMMLRHDGSGQMCLETAELAPGVYVVKVKSSRGTVTRRMAVVR